MPSKSKSTLDVTRWRQPGSAGFLAFLEDAKPMIPSEKGGFERYEIPNDRVRDEIVAMLDGGFSTAVICWPRRHGKTVQAALIIDWRFLTRQTQTIAIVANSEKQTVDTAFRLARTILEQTPYTSGLVKSGAIKVGADWIEYPALGNRIQGFASSPASLYGKKVSVAQVSELHAAKSDGIYQALASSTIDSDDGLVIVDSTVGPRSSPLYGLYQLAQKGQDETLYFSHIEYRDLDDAIENRPTWIKPERLRSRAAQMLPMEFAQQHLNQWTAGTNALFPPEVIKECVQKYRRNPDAIANGRKYAIGGGLDRAMVFSLHGDRTVVSCVLKTTGAEDDEPHYWVLGSRKLSLATESAIKGALGKFRRDFGMTHVAIERYEAQDIAIWSQGEGLQTDLVHATPKQQQTAFLTLANAARDGRLHIDPRFGDLISEMGTFEYELRATGTSDGSVARFQHAKGAHDDHVYSLAWAVYSLREQEVGAYEISSIECDAPWRVAELCALNGGQIVPPCADDCRSMRSVRDLFSKYRTKNVADVSTREETLEHFIMSKLENTGLHTVRR